MSVATSHCRPGSRILSCAPNTAAGLFPTTDKRHSIDRPGSSTWVLALNLKSNPARVQNLRTPPENILCTDFGKLDSSAVRGGESCGSGT